MKRFIFFIAFISFFMTAMADWTYGTAYFKGDKPSNCLCAGVVTIYYNGSLSQKSIEGNTEYWEGTGDICVIYPKNYTGLQMVFLSNGGIVQVQHLR
ncbi:MAG: hypothetical protein IKP48_01385 [Bacteroidaceae bacterium]|nr:hypothetical protein [Bacteroidaceae bacterium]